MEQHLSILQHFIYPDIKGKPLIIFSPHESLHQNTNQRIRVSYKVAALEQEIVHPQGRLTDEKAVVTSISHSNGQVIVSSILFKIHSVNQMECTKEEKQGFLLNVLDCLFSVMFEGTTVAMCQTMVATHSYRVSGHLTPRPIWGTKGPKCHSAEPQTLSAHDYDKLYFFACLSSPDI